MNTNHFRSRLGGVLMAFSLLFGIAMASSLTAQAQYRDDRDGQYRRDRNRDSDRDRDWRRDRNRNDQNGNWRRDRQNDNYGYGRNDGYYGNGGYGNGGYNNIYRAAQNQGYQDGLNTGANDANRGQSYNPQRSHYYRDATYGYNSSYGNKGQYKQAYRDGFVRGYNEGYRRYGGNNGGYNNRRGGIFGNWFPFTQ